MLSRDFIAGQFLYVNLGPAVQSISISDPQFRGGTKEKKKLTYHP